MVIPAPKTIATATDWANRDSRDSEELRRVRVAVPETSAGSLSSYLRVESRDEYGPGSYYRTVAAYFVLEGRLFRMTLEFKDGDPRESVYKGIFARVIESVKGL